MLVCELGTFVCVIFKEFTELFCAAGAFFCVILRVWPLSLYFHKVYWVEGRRRRIFVLFFEFDLFRLIFTEFTELLGAAGQFLFHF